MAKRPAELIWALSLGLALGACVTAPPRPEYAPYESLTQILADFTMHRNDDLYRFGYPKDISGQNLFRATLARIDHYETQFPEFARRAQDVLAVSRAQLLTRLGDYEGAMREYRNLGPSPSAEMSAAAQQDLGYVQELAKVALAPPASMDLQILLRDLRDKRERLMHLAEKFEGTPYAPLARMEAEKADTVRVTLLFNSRYMLPDGLTQALREADDLAKRYADSRLAYRHRLRVGQCYYIAAREYADLNDPSQTGFDDATFDNLIASARQVFFEISQIDGAPEKLEARAELEALESFASNIKDLRQ